MPHLRHVMPSEGEANQLVFANSIVIAVNNDIHSFYDKQLLTLKTFSQKPPRRLAQIINQMVKPTSLS